MLVYNYHPETGQFLGSSEAQPSPAEPGVYLVPAYATDKAPPDLSDPTKMIIFFDGDWRIRDIPTEDPPDLEPEPEPETPEEIQARQIAEIEREYDPQRKTLLEYILTADALGLTDLVAELRAQFQALVVERDQKIEEVMSGANP